MKDSEATSFNEKASLFLSRAVSGKFSISVRNEEAQRRTFQINFIVLDGIARVKNYTIFEP